jgi:ATP-dependent DNA ligase
VSTVRLVRRREVLAEVCAKLDIAVVAFSPAVMGTGRALYEAALAGGHEGVMAKQLQSVYRPGKRCSAWKKIKTRGQVSILYK